MEQNLKEASKWRRIQFSTWRMIKSTNEDIFCVNWKKYWSISMILQKLSMWQSMIIWAAIFQAVSAMHQGVETFQEMKIFYGNKQKYIPRSHPDLEYLNFNLNWSIQYTNSLTLTPWIHTYFIFCIIYSHVKKDFIYSFNGLFLYKDFTFFLVAELFLPQNFIFDLILFIQSWIMWKLELVLLSSSMYTALPFITSYKKQT